MRKIISCLAVFFVLCSFMPVVYAEPEITPFYNNITNVTAKLEISPIGLATVTNGYQKSFQRYEDNVSGKISDERFANLSSKYEMEQQSIVETHRRVNHSRFVFSKTAGHKKRVSSQNNLKSHKNTRYVNVTQDEAPTIF